MTFGNKIRCDGQNQGGNPSGFPVKKSARYRPGHKDNPQAGERKRQSEAQLISSQQPHASHHDPIRKRGFQNPRFTFQLRQQPMAVVSYIRRRAGDSPFTHIRDIARPKKTEHRYDADDANQQVSILCPEQICLRVLSEKLAKPAIWRSGAEI